MKFQVDFWDGLYHSVVTKNKAPTNRNLIVTE